MKKKVLSLVLLFLGFYSFGLESTSGDYVIYRDASFTDETWIGFLYYDAKTYAAVLYTPSEKRRICVDFTVSTRSGSMELKGQNVLTKIPQTDKKGVEAVNYLMQLLPDLYGWGQKTAMSKTKKLVSKTANIENVGYFGGTVFVNACSSIPLFGIQSVQTAERKNILTLSRIGRVSDPNEFFRFAVPFEVPSKKKSGFVPETSAKKQVEKFGAVKLHLDNQWQHVAENAFLLGDSAFLIVSEVNASMNELVALFSFSSKDRIIDMEKMQLTGNENKFILVNEAYDTASQTVNIDKKIAIRSGNKYTIVSLTVDGTDYKKYKTYFDNIYK